MELFLTPHPQTFFIYIIMYTYSIQQYCKSTYIHIMTLHTYLINYVKRMNLHATLFSFPTYYFNVKSLSSNTYNVCTLYLHVMASFVICISALINVILFELEPKGLLSFCDVLSICVIRIGFLTLSFTYLCIRILCNIPFSYLLEFPMRSCM